MCMNQKHQSNNNNKHKKINDDSMRDKRLLQNKSINIKTLPGA